MAYIVVDPLEPPKYCGYDVTRQLYMSVVADTWSMLASMIRKLMM